MTEADHLAHPQALHGHPGLHPHSLGHPHGLSVGHPHPHHGDLHHSQPLALVEAGGQVQGEAQALLDAEHGHRGHVHGHDGHDQGLQQSGENGVGIEDQDDDPRDDEGLDEAEMHSDGDHPGDQRTQLAVRTQGATQLTLTYQGEAYVFDTVPPEKVRIGPPWASLWSKF